MSNQANHPEQKRFGHGVINDNPKFDLLLRRSGFHLKTPVIRSQVHRNVVELGRRNQFLEIDFADKV
jgi:hypothetical protein